jgi:cell division protein FtsB
MFASVIFMVWVCFLNDIDLFYILRTRGQLADMKKELQRMESLHKEAQSDLHELSTNMATLEKYAREEYNMVRPGEKLFIFKEKQD